MKQLLIISLLLSMSYATHAFAQAGADDVAVTPDMLKQKTKELEDAKRGKPLDPNAAPANATQVSPTNPNPAAVTTAAPTIPQTNNQTPPVAAPSSAAATAPKTGDVKPDQAVASDPNAPKTEPKPGDKPAATTAQDKIIKQQVTIKTEHDILAPANWSGTLMFDPNDLAVLKTARGIYLKNGGDPTYAANKKSGGLKLSDQDIKQANKTIEIQTPILLLNTIAYFDKTNWSIWINGQKYNNKIISPDLEIVEVNKESITLAWTTQYLDKIMPEWKNISIPEADANHRLVKRGNNKIFIDASTGKVTFKLYPNQTFSGKNLDILEGKVSNTNFDVIQILASEQPISDPAAVDKMLDAATPTPPTKAIK